MTDDQDDQAVSDDENAASRATPGDGADPGRHADGAPPQRVVHEITISTRSMWQVVVVVLTTLTALWAIDRARTLVGLVVVSAFFALALVPGVDHLHRRFHWRRGAAVGAIYAAGVGAVLVLVGFLIPAIINLADRIQESGSQWLTDLDTTLSGRLGVELFSGTDTSAVSNEAATSIAEWADEAFGTVVSVASSGVGLAINLATIAMFTFYLTADFPRIQRSFLSWFAPDTQRRLGWTIDEAIRQTGGYFYSRLLLMLINGIGFFATMLVVGIEVTLAVPLALFGSFVSVFIPAIGTYIGGAIPILITLAIEGLVAALIVLGYVLVYQQIENYWLSPRISAKTMTLNGGVAFGAALGGGALFGPMGAFMALPVAALITSIIKNYRRTYDVVYDSTYATRDEPA